jgi:multidrug resistance efflux pump
MGRLEFKTSGRSLLLTALVALCLLEAVSLLEMSRVRHRAEAHGASASGTMSTGPSSALAATSSAPIARTPASTSSSAGSLSSPDGAGAAAGPRGGRPIQCTGRVEAKREDTPIGTLVAGVVAEVYVERGDLVKKGDALFRLDDRDFRTQLGTATANLAAAEAQLDRVLTAPHQGDVTASEAAVEEARAHLNDAELTYRRSQALFERKVVAPQDRDRDRYLYIAGKAALARLEAELRRLKATWEKDKLTARAAVGQARAQVEGIQVSLGRVLVRSAVDGRVRHVRVRPGQFAGAAWNEPLVTLSDSRERLVRVDIDDADLAAFAPRSRAVAALKGHPGVTFPLTYYDTDPALISRPGPVATGSGAEARERRVLQVLYELPRESPIGLYAGQEMEVSIEPATPPEGVAAAPDTSTARCEGGERPAAAADDPRVAAVPGPRPEPSHGRSDGRRSRPTRDGEAPSKSGPPVTAPKE